MGQSSSRSNSFNKKSYNNDKYKPGQNGVTANNNQVSCRPKSMLYRITEQEHVSEILQLTLENDSLIDSFLISPLQLTAMFETETRFHFKITDPRSPRFEVRYEDMRKSFPKFKKRCQQTDYDVDFHEEPFALTVTRRTTGSKLFDVKPGSLRYEDERISISLNLHTSHIYGLGERRKRFHIDTNLQHQYVFWSSSVSQQENKNGSGVHPFFMALEEDGNAFGVFLLNSTAIEVDLTPGTPSPTLIYTMNGGILDFFIFTGPSPLEVVQQYQELIGRPHLPPYWSLGYHLSCTSYENEEDLHNIIQRNRQTLIPYESQWTDVDMLKGKTSWSIKSDKLKQIVEDLHRNGQKYVTHVNPGVPINDINLPAYTDGLTLDIFIKNFLGTRPLVGKSWCGDVVYPDFSHPDIEEYWFRRAEYLYEDLPFDGVNLELNEPTNFCSGCVENCSLTDQHEKDHPKFVPDTLAGRYLFENSLCPSSIHHRGLHFNIHNLYGHLQMHITHNVLSLVTKKRSLIISRSTFSGSGHYGGHTVSDNMSTFNDLNVSIPAMLDFNLCGIPLTGTDVGGVNSSCSEQLMIRWTQLGSFYPFMRNHNGHPNNATTPQDPAHYSKPTQDILRDIIKIRYSLIPTLYTLFYENHVRGSPVIRPLFMHYSKDKKTYDKDKQFMWGSCLLISPCLTEDETTVSAYFPFDVWYDFYTGQRISKVGTTLNLASPLNHVNVHIRGGSILVTQSPAINTHYSRKNDFSLVIALDSKHQSIGQLYWDDGEQLDAIDTQTYNLIKFIVKQNCLTSTVVERGYPSARMKLSLIQIFGLFVLPTNVVINGQSVDYSYNDRHCILQINLKCPVDLLEPVKLEWS